MKQIVPLLLIATLAGCDQSDSPRRADALTVRELAADPARLKELRQQCKTERAKLGDVVCNRVAEATNQRFFGDGDTPYTPPEESPKF